MGRFRLVKLVYFGVFDSTGFNFELQVLSFAEPIAVVASVTTSRAPLLSICFFPLANPKRWCLFCAQYAVK